MKKRTIVADSPSRPEPARRQLRDSRRSRWSGREFVIGAAADCAVAAGGRAGDRVRGSVECRQVERDQCARAQHPARVREPHAGAHAADQFLRVARRRAASPTCRATAMRRCRRRLKQAWQDFLWQYVTTRDDAGGAGRRRRRAAWRAPTRRRAALGIRPVGTRPVLVLATKVDKLNLAERRDAVAAIRARACGALLGDARGQRAGVLRDERALGVEEADAVIARGCPHDRRSATASLRHAPE